MLEIQVLTTGVLITVGPTVVVLVTHPVVGDTNAVTAGEQVVGAQTHL